MVLAVEWGTGQVLWSMFWLFLWIIWFWLLIMVFSDLFRDHEESGWGKALWALFVIIVPYLGVFVYLLVRGQGMGERAMAQAKVQQAQFDSYVKDVAGSSSPTDQIAQAKQLLDSGAIDQEEFDHLKRKALS